ncbi:hypothetical protein [Clostridium luticellarii]|jgi:hypothetical protein|uniref:Uncharacterized protein n=1 Tax=Clostridium luticellarii TaxID=1691940 RepID=A0A2T0BLI7_9CLOT|nr:hypothetical protein [Clostridium luticellarii]PRR84741.1 hypothetical protein CLLU_22800 [Clostridium luticellarii]
MSEELRITSLDEIKKAASGQLVKLAGWGEEPWVAKIKRVSLLDLIKEGVIPNSLLAAAQEIFMGKQSGKSVNIGEISKVMEAVAKSMLVEPTWEQLEDRDIKLTDEQVTELFQYAQGGLKGLERFRKDQERLANNQSVRALQQIAQRNSKDTK